MKRPRPWGITAVGTPERPSKRKVVHAESPVQKAIVEFHATALVCPFDAILFAVPNGELRDPVTAAILSGRRKRHPAEPPETEAEMMRPAGQGVLPGAVDLVLLVAGGRAVLIEVKRPKTADAKKGTQSARQKCFQKYAEALGHEYVLLDSVEGYEALLISKGVRLRVRSIWPRYPTPPATIAVSG